MRTNFNLKKKNSKGEALVYLIIRWDNHTLKYSTKESIDPRFWETDKEKRNNQRAKQTREFPEYPEFNARLNWMESTAKTVFRQFLNDNGNRSPNVEELKKQLDIKLRNTQNEPKKDFFGFAKQFISEAPHKYNSETGKAISKGTIKTYENALVTLREYATKKQKRIDFSTFDLNFYQEYLEYLTIEKNLKKNTVGKHIKTIKTILNDSADRGFHNNFAYKSKKFKVLTEEIHSIYLDEKELDELYKLDLSDNIKLERVRDLFLVGCWTGLRFSDFSKIEEKHIQGEFIEIKTQKTDETVVIPIHKTVKSIMEKYRGMHSTPLPPSLSNDKTNKNLKAIGKMLPCLHVSVQTKVTKGGVLTISNPPKWELITTHTARRSFATNLHKQGLSSINIMKITGHRTEKAFLTYIKVSQKESAMLLQQHWLRMEKIEQQMVELT